MNCASACPSRPKRRWAAESLPPVRDTAVSGVRPDALPGTSFDCVGRVHDRPGAGGTREVLCRSRSADVRFLSHPERGVLECRDAILTSAAAPRRGDGGDRPPSRCHLATFASSEGVNCPDSGGGPHTVRTACNTGSFGGRVAGFTWNQWQFSIGTGGGIGWETVASLDRNAWRIRAGMRRCSRVHRGAALPLEMLGSVFGKGGARATEPVARTKGSDQA